MNTISLSLTDILNPEYVQSVCNAAAFFRQGTGAPLQRLAEEKIDFFPLEFQRKLEALIGSAGTQIINPMEHCISGNSSGAFEKSSSYSMAPLSTMGLYRIGENGKLYVTSKSEHYHASLGHDFPGFALVENAKKLGIPQITHNNTRGTITRLAEKELVSMAEGTPGVRRDKVLNLQTGSLAVEAALKILLARFYSFGEEGNAPVYEGKTPVLLVIGDNDMGLEANYHGTTILGQMLRGIWPDLYKRMEKAGIFKIVPVRINDIEHFKQTLSMFHRGEYKIAGFIHEIILMNYGAIKLKEQYLQEAYVLCRKNSIPTVVDEIQSCAWYPGGFLFKQYELDPDIVVVGKGFPGGQYAASRIILSSEFDNLPQFGALITNGQEELSSLCYLVTSAFIDANTDDIRKNGTYYHQALEKIAGKYANLVEKAEGDGHLSSLFFHDSEKAAYFAKHLNEEGIDISAHTYKKSGAPSALTKLPLITTPPIIDFIIKKMDETLKKM